MSWKVHETDEVFAGLRGLCSNVYRMYDPCDHRYYYDHECDAYECVVEDAAEEYERLLRHCDHQREQLARHEMEDGMDNIDGGTEVERIEGSSKVRAGSSITDELREYAVEHECDSYRKLLNAIADRIDAEHEAKVSYWQGASYKDGYDEGFASADDWLGQHEDAMAEHGWVKLPVDADGVPIRVGDELTNGTDLPAKVRCMALDESGWMVSTRELRGYGVPPATLRHHQPDSWERIMDDAEKLARGDNAAVMELVERCRRLAHDGR